MKRLIRLFILGAAGICLLMGGILIWTRPVNVAAAHRAAAKDFRADWQARLSRCHRMQDVRALVTQAPPGHLEVRTLRDGSWIAIAWHCTHDGNSLADEWDGSVLRDSRGKLLWTAHHFCGEEGFQAEFENVPARSLSDYYQHAGFPLTPLSADP